MKPLIHFDPDPVVIRTQKVGFQTHVFRRLSLTLPACYGHILRNTKSDLAILYHDFAARIEQRRRTYLLDLLPVLC